MGDPKPEGTERMAPPGPTPGLQPTPAGGRTQAARSRRDPTPSELAGMYGIAYDESKRAIDDQADELNNIRTRAVQYLAFIGTATAFLVGATLKATERTTAFYWLAGSATTLSLLTLLAVIMVLSPWRNWEYRLSGEDLVHGWIENEVPPPSEAHLVRDLTLRYDEMRSFNENVLQKQRWVYTAEIALGTVQLMLWVWLAWIVG